MGVKWTSESTFGTQGVSPHSDTWQTIRDVILGHYIMSWKIPETANNRKPSYPALPKHPESTEERLPNRGDTEVGVLIVIKGHGQTCPERGTFRHRSGVTRTQTIIMLTKETSTHLLIRKLLIHVIVVPPGLVELAYKELQGGCR
ncbi:hypothetical protein AVEN_123007-1 [Araneus ventricosus]|uniref:Uncharacterized protein n=1 Tax=Araneus ventricosus TaxID=182803 RepID=A0A4Y2CWK0_ARAVE|nr:hypothetical protein AVEN_123007-1 [Araneus ventricosus]